MFCSRSCLAGVRGIRTLTLRSCGVCMFLRLAGLMLRGIGPSMSRAALLTAAQMSTYDHTKVIAKQNGLLSEGVALHCVAAGISGFAAQAACNPADVLKSRVMSAMHAASANSAHGVTTTPTVWGVAMNIVRHEGPAAFLQVRDLNIRAAYPTLLFAQRSSQVYPACSRSKPF
jgi:hypothetical protein